MIGTGKEILKRTAIEMDRKDKATFPLKCHSALVLPHLYKYDGTFCGVLALFYGFVLICARSFWLMRKLKGTHKGYILELASQSHLNYKCCDTHGSAILVQWYITSSISMKMCNRFFYMPTFT